MKTLIAAVLVALMAPASAKPVVNVVRPAKAKPFDPKRFGAVARVAFGRELRAMPPATGRKAELLTPLEETAAQIQKLLRGPILRRGVTGLFVVDAKTGEPLFAVNADDPLNPASNVKMISTATALELLGATFRYPTRVLGPEPTAGTVRGDVYLFGSYDPTLAVGDFDQIASQIAARGIKQIDGNVIIGGDETRDGIYRANVPLQITAGEPGAAPSVNLPTGFDLVTIKVLATTAGRPQPARLFYRSTISTTPSGQPHILLTIGGTIGQGGKVDYQLPTKQRTATAVYSLISALRARSIHVTGTMKTMELGEFVAAAAARGAMPVELGRHESEPVANIVERINKWSINWLADRLIITAAALARRQVPSMELALEAMYAWLDRHPHLPKSSLLIDTGSGLSYHTQISPHELVSVVRSAGGYAGDSDPAASRAWLRSLSIAGLDGTLQHRFRNTDIRGRIIGKTGSLSNAIALSGILDIDPQRPLAFSLVTNTDSPLSKPTIRRAHEQVIGEICKYLAKTSSRLVAPPPPIATLPATTPLPDDVEEPSELDTETANQK
jgi:D-alanyl-D-alanine carboxypeptidase/D-alanyl-D-alanine-endopeptidase (penicillin-binding protein 4)